MNRGFVFLCVLLTATVLLPGVAAERVYVDSSYNGDLVTLCDATGGGRDLAVGTAATEIGVYDGPNKVPLVSIYSAPTVRSGPSSNC